MLTTYVRKWYMNILIYIAIIAGTFVFTNLISLLAGWMLLGTLKIAFTSANQYSMANGFPDFLVMGSFMGFALSLISPFIMWSILHLHKYHYESLKLKMVPIWGTDMNNVQLEPEAVDGKEPYWIKPYEFEATMRNIGTITKGGTIFMHMADEKNYHYMMNPTQYSMIVGKMVDGKYKGKFIHCENGYYTTIREVE